MSCSNPELNWTNDNDSTVKSSNNKVNTDFTTVEVTAGGGPQQMMNLSSLESLTTYECRVRAMTSTSNQHLLGPFSDSLFFTTLLSSKF